MMKILAPAFLLVACSSQNQVEPKSHEETQKIKASAAVIIFTKDGPTIVITNQKGVGGQVRGEAPLAAIAPIATQKFSDEKGCLLAPFVAEVRGTLYRSNGSNIIELSSVNNPRYSNADEVYHLTKYPLQERTKMDDVCK